MSKRLCMKMFSMVNAHDLVQFCDTNHVVKVIEMRDVVVVVYEL